MNIVNFLLGLRLFIVLSGSMEPAIKTGGVVLVSKSPVYNIGDVITFKNTGNTNVTHRVQYKFPESNEYLTSGDANKDFDNGKVNGENIVGKVIFTVPYLGYVGNFAKTPRGFILLVIIPATIIIYEELKSLKKEFDKLRAKALSKTNDPPPPKNNSKITVLIPVIGALAIFVSVTISYFSDNEQSTNNILGAANSFGEKVGALYDSNEFTCESGATNLTKPQAKFAILKKDGNNLDVSVILQNATPLSSYDIWINQDPGGCPLDSPTSVGAITTDASGNGSGNATTTLVLGATKYWISAVGGRQVLRSTAVSF